MLGLPNGSSRPNMTVEDSRVFCRFPDGGFWRLPLVVSLDAIKYVVLLTNDFLARG